MANTIITNYFEGQADILDKQFNNSVIKRHQPSTGDNREVILKDWLTTHLPKLTTPELGGHIVDKDNNQSSQIDVIINNHALPRLRAFNRSYFFAESVITAIQVKSVLNSQTLKDAFNNLASVHNCKRHFKKRGLFPIISEEIPTGIFAYKTSFNSPKNLISSLVKYQQKNISPVGFVCVNKFAYVAYNTGSWRYTNKKGVRESPKGYILIDRSKGCIWRMLINLSSETNMLEAATFDLQNYFIEENS